MKKEDVKEGIAKISGDDAHHIINVLRFKIGEELIISDGENQYITSIIGIEDSSVILKIIESYDKAVESPIDITLFQGLPKSDKMDLIVQKCTEIGVKRIVPIETEFSLIKIKEKSIDKKINRWEKISQEASKQSGRSIVPDVLMPVDFKMALNSINEFDLCLIPYEKENSIKLKDVLKKHSDAKNICVFIGPEGGFSDNEIEIAVKFGVVPVTLGPRILRTETAGIVASSIILYELGDLG